MEEEIMHFGWGKYIFKLLLMITLVGIPFGAFLNYITHHELLPIIVYGVYGVTAFLLGLISCVVIKKSTDNSKQLATAGIIIPLPIIAISIVMLMILPMASEKIEKITNQSEKEAKSFAESFEIVNPNPPDYKILTMTIFIAFNLAFFLLILVGEDKSGLIFYIIAPVVYYLIYKLFVSIMNKIAGAIA